MNFDVYPETMPDATGTNWAVEGGNLFCFNFAINSDQPLPEHYEQAREKIVKFCYRAIKKLGNPPGSTWLLTVLGEASATGDPAKNKELARRRALMLADYVVAEFEVYWRDRERSYIGPEYRVTPKLVPNYLIIGDKLARSDPTAKRGVPAKRIDERQSEYRRVSFIFKAASPSNQAVVTHGWIRKVAGAEFTEKTTDFETLTDIGGAFWSLASTLLKSVGGYAILETLSIALKSIATPLALGKHMVSFLIPSNAISGYQLRDRAGAPVIYRFNGSQHSDSWSLFEFLELMGVIEAVIKVSKQLGTAKNAKDIATNLAVMYQVKALIIKNTIELIRSVLGDRAARSWAVILNNFELFQKGQLVAASEWSPFTYDRRAPIKRVGAMGGPAKRATIGSFWSANESLDFGGPVEGTWTAFNAAADMSGFDPFGNGLLQGAWATGTMTRMEQRVVFDV